MDEENLETTETVEDNADTGVTPEPETDEAGETSLEEELLSKLEDDTSDNADTRTVPTDKKADGQSTSVFDLDGKVRLKAGQSLSPENIKELERGFLRQADYTKKTQEIAQVRREVEATVAQVKEVNDNPSLLRKYFTQEEILGGFQPKEILGWIMPRIGISPQTWSEFRKWYKENGPEESDLPAQPAYSPELHALKNELGTVKTTLTKYEKEREDFARERAETAFNTEVDAAVSKYPSVKRRVLLAEIAADYTERPIEEIARELHDARQLDLNEYIKSKQTRTGGAGRRPRGSSVPITHKKPQTFEELDEAIENLSW